MDGGSFLPHVPKELPARRTEGVAPSPAPAYIELWGEVLPRPTNFIWGLLIMCCNNNRNRCGCGCGCHRPMPMPCCDCGCGGGATTLPSFPDWPVYARQEMEFPVYISVPATMSRGTANLSASVEMAESCGCARG